MPYINQGDRFEFIDDLDHIIRTLSACGWHPGLVNFIFFSILKAWFMEEKCYATICSIKGTLGCVWSELYRRYFGRYEDEAIERNGDIE